MVAKLFETCNAGNMNLLFELSNTVLPEMYSLIMDWGLGCPVFMLKPLVYVTKRSEHCVEFKGSGLPQKF